MRPRPLLTLQCDVMKKVRWGVLGVAKIAVTRVIPAMQAGECSEIVGIASRDRARAEAAARDLGIPKAYGSYEEMLADPEIDAVYNPLPNHLHLPWSTRAAEAGKHVLCEKPIGLNVKEALELMAVRDRTGVKIGEGFMVQNHPQWLRIVELVRAGRIGQLRSAVGTFSYFKLDADNIRNIREYGGGALFDIGCYPIKTSRMVFGEEPVRVSAAITRDPRFDNIDMLTSAILEYPVGTLRVHLQYADRAAAEHALLRQHRADRDGDALQRHAGRDVAHTHRRRPRPERRRTGDRGVAGLRPVHHSGRPVLARDSRRRRAAGAAGRCGTNHGGDRRRVPVGRDRPQAVARGRAARGECDGLKARCSEGIRAIVMMTVIRGNPGRAEAALTLRCG